MDNQFLTWVVATESVLFIALIIALVTVFIHLKDIKEVLKENNNTEHKIIMEAMKTFFHDTIERLDTNNNEHQAIMERLNRNDDEHIDIVNSLNNLNAFIKLRFESFDTSLSKYFAK